MKSIKNALLILCLFALFFTLGCQNKKPAPPELISIDLLRGAIVLCGGDQFGDVNFSFSGSDVMRDTFNLAISLLHSFEWIEAEKAFTKVIDKDPECVMAYWGVAMCNLGHPRWAPTRKKYEKSCDMLELAEPLTKTKREEDYLDAIGTYYATAWDESNHNARALAMEKAMEALYKKYENDKEAAVFYAVALFRTADPKDKSYTKQKMAGGILESIFPDQPNHPGIAHYIIHHYDNPELAELALPTARRYADIAPASAHAQHMPSHIFTRLGLWDESIDSNINSANSARCYAEEVEMDGHWSNEIHAMDYLIYAYLQKGDNENAMEQYEYLQTMYNVFPKTSIAYPFAAIPARMALENKNWAKAATIEVHESKLQWEEFPWSKSIVHFARALGASRIGDISSAQKELEILQSLHQKLVEDDHDYSADQVMVEIKAAQAWLQFAQGNNEEAIYLMQEAALMEENTSKHPVTPGEVLPARELMGDMFLALDKPSEALEAYEIDLMGHPNRFNGVYGAAIAAKGIGDEEKARMYFEQLINLTEFTNSDRPEVAEARAFVGKTEI
jgi:tetratricopeptide (TPR) repeat protein